MGALKDLIARRGTALSLEQRERRLRDAITGLGVATGPKYTAKRLAEYHDLLTRGGVYQRAMEEAHYDWRTNGTA